MIRVHVAKDGTKSYGVRVHRGAGRYEWVGTFPTKREARIAEGEALKRTRRPERITCGQLADRFLADYERTRKDSSIDRARYAIAVFKRHHADTPAEAFDREDAEAFARRYDWAVSVLKTCFARAERQGAIERSPFADLQRRRTPGRRDLDPLTVEEVDRLGQAALEVHGWYGPRMRALILFAAYTGVRPGELVALEWRDVDLSNGRLQVRRRLYQGRLDYPKTGPRMVALVPHARDALTGLPRDSELVFSSKRGRRLSSGSLRSWYWQPVWGRFGRKVDLYELRHFCGHYLYVVCDLPSRVVAAQLGHSSPRKVEELYGHFKVGALEEIDRAFGANVAPLRSIEKAS